MPYPRLGRRSSAIIALIGLGALVPGWSGRLVRADHEAMLAEAAQSHTQLGVTRAGGSGDADDAGAAGEEWHLQYLDSWPVRMLEEMGLRPQAAHIVPPTFVAHVPPGADRADGYFRIETSWHWPWWRPGGGLDWTLPPR